ncbi:MAG: bifunctional 5,10-methylenetetrahydrofolate dehydrogenase/5,10-methenyltetrahydrofolate cyclohydrolase [Actinomycetota bacterium]
MTAQIIDGKVIAKKVRAEVALGVAELGRPPGLAAILVGDDPASHVYVGSKERAAKAAGMQSFVHRLAADVSQSTLLSLIDDLNRDQSVDGILLQLPLPRGLDGAMAVERIDPAKDIDGLTATNAGLLTLGRPRFVPCTPLGIQRLLEDFAIKVQGAHVVVVGRSNLVGRPISILLSLKAETANATVTLCHTATTSLEAYTRQADILIVAAGIPNGITGDFIKPGATVIDVGISRGEDGGLVGDVDFESAIEVAGAITPVPGGVGPMTVAMLLSNTLRAAKSTN